MALKQQNLKQQPYFLNTFLKTKIMKLLITASSIEKMENLLNKHFYSTTYKIVENKVMFKNPLQENKNLTFKTKGKKFQVLTN